MAAIWTSIELTDSEALVAQARGAKEAPSLRMALRIPLPEARDATPEARAQARGAALAQGLKQAGLKPLSAVMVASKRYVTVRYITLPSTDDKELAQMANFEAQRHVPFHSNRHFISHHVMRKDPIAGSHVLLAAADGPDIDELLGVAQAAGIGVDAIDVSSLAQFNTVAAAAPPGFAEETAAILHLGAQSVDISIISRGLLIFTRSAPMGYERLAADLKESAPIDLPLSLDQLRQIDMMRPLGALQRFGLAPAEGESALEGSAAPAPATRVRAWLDRLAVEVRRSYEFASRELSCPPVTALYLSGDAASWPGFDEYLQVNLSVEARRVDPFAALHVEKTALDGTRADGGPFAGVIGALARHWREKAVAVDLLPADYRSQRMARRRRQSALTTAALAVAALALGVVYVRQQAGLREEEVNLLRQEVRKLQPRVESLTDKEKQLQIINEYRLDKRSALAILDTISGFPYLPTQVALTSLKFSKGGTVEMDGYALTLEDLNRFIRDLEKAAYQNETIFRGGVKLKPNGQKLQERFDASRPQPVWQFQLAGELSPPS
ncbi:MAG: pilus assembly protein PilM [Candidatus Sumerlaeota bacterium]|nr:pilus assembly protein PilM [Candidatus Sumerlaeota bacterium]